MKMMQQRLVLLAAKFFFAALVPIYPTTTRTTLTGVHGLKLSLTRVSPGAGDPDFLGRDDSYNRGTTNNGATVVANNVWAVREQMRDARMAAAAAAGRGGGAANNDPAPGGVGQANQAANDGAIGHQANPAPVGQANPGAGQANADGGQAPALGTFRPNHLLGHPSFS